MLSYAKGAYILTIGENYSSMVTSFVSKVWFIGLIILCLIYAVKWQILKKAGEPGWKALIPIYSNYMLYKCFWSTSAFGAEILLYAGSKFLFNSQLQKITLISVFNPNTYLNIIIGLLPIGVILIMRLILVYRISAAFGHGVGMMLGLIFLPIVFFPILAWGGDGGKVNTGSRRSYKKHANEFKKEDACPSENEEEEHTFDSEKQRKKVMILIKAVIAAGIIIIICALSYQFQKMLKIAESQMLNYKIENWMFYSNAEVGQFVEQFGEYTDVQEEKAFWETKKHSTYSWDKISLVNHVTGQLTVEYLGDELQDVKWMYEYTGTDELDFNQAYENLSHALDKVYNLDSESFIEPLKDKSYIERMYTFDKEGLQYLFAVRVYEESSVIELEFEPSYEFKN